MGVFILKASQSNATAWTTAVAGDVTLLTNWTDGLSSPSSFATPGDTWTIVHAMTLPSGSTWTVGASSAISDSVIIMPGGTLELSGTVPSGTIIIYGGLNINGGEYRFTATSGYQDITIYGSFVLNSGLFSQWGNSTTTNLNVQGDFTINAGTFSWAGTTPVLNMKVQGDFNINGGYVCDSGGAMNIDVSGNYSMTGGILSPNGDDDSLNVSGNYLMNTGTISYTGNSPRFYIQVSGDAIINGSTITATGNSPEFNMDVWGNNIVSASSITLSGNGPQINMNVFGNSSISASSITLSGNGPQINMNVFGNNSINAGTTFNISGTVPALNLNNYGNFTMTSGSFISSGTSATIDMTTLGIFDMSNGLFQTGGTYSNIAHKMYGDCHISGNSAMTNTSGGSNTIHLMRPSSSGIMLISNTSIGTWSKTTVYVDTYSVAQLDNDFSSSTGVGTSYGVIVNGKLTCPAAYAVNGMGIFRVNGVATLEVANAAGINGNITTTGTRTFHTAAKYKFNGTVPQVTGSYLPVALTIPGVLTIDNNAGVTLSQNTATTGTLSLVTGILHTGSYTITTSGATTAVTGASAATYVEGTLKKTISGCSSVNYEVGGLGYSPVNLSLSTAGTAGSIGVKCSSGGHPSIGTSGILATNMANQYWTISNTGAAGPATVLPTFTYNFSDMLGGSNLSFTIQKYAAGAWLGAPLATTNTLFPYSSAPTAAVTLATLAGDYAVGNTCGTPITGVTSICTISATTSLGNATAGGIWSSSDATIATVSPTGSVTGMATGVAVIYYNTGTCSVSAVVTVGTSPISGITSVCPSLITALTDATPGGIWSSGDPTVATVSAMGIVYGVSGGTAIISYAVGSCLPATTTVTVAPLAPITGVSSIYLGTATTLSDITPSGTWSSSNPAVASITATGVAYGVVAGTSTISYTLGSCSATYGMNIMFRYLITADSISNPPDTLCTTPTFYVQANGYSPLLRLKTYYGDGTADSIAFTSSGMVAFANAAHAYAAPGSYTVKQVMYYNNNATDSLLFSYYHNYCRTFHMKFYIDTNNNCTKDLSEIYNPMPLLVSIDSAGVAIDTLSATSGLYYKANGGPGTIYAFSVLPASVYTSCPALGIWYDTISATAGSYPVTYAGMSCSPTTDFDLRIFGSLRCGTHAARATILLDNTYCTPENATVTMTISPKYSYTSGTPAPTTIVGNTITWLVSGVSSLMPPTNIVANFTATGLAMGDTAFSTYSISPTTGDVNPVNNYVIRVDTVKAGFDPNFIDVFPGGCFSIDTEFQYSIHFENTGNDTAHNIYVMDTLSDNLMVHTLRIVAASAPMDIVEYNEGVHNIVKFDFPNINLRDSSHHGECDGSVTFTIKPQPGLFNGARIKNRAGIYFDINEVVMTNEVDNRKGCDNTGISDVKGTSGIELFPNPTTGEITIRSSTNIATISVTNLVGQTVYSNTCNAMQVNVNVTDFASGVYLVKVNGTEVRKFVKQ